MSIIKEAINWMETNKDDICVVYIYPNSDGMIKFSVIYREKLIRQFIFSFYEDQVFVDPSGLSYYKDDPLALDLLNLLIEKNLEDIPNNIILFVDEIRQNIVLRTI